MTKNLRKIVAALSALAMACAIGVFAPASAQTFIGPIPTCNSVNQALQWTPGVGMSCVTVTASASSITITGGGTPTNVVGGSDYFVLAEQSGVLRAIDPTILINGVACSPNSASGTPTLAGGVCTLKMETGGSQQWLVDPAYEDPWGLIYADSNHKVFQGGLYNYPGCNCFIFDAFHGAGNSLANVTSDGPGMVIQAGAPTFTLSAIGTQGNADPQLVMRTAINNSSGYDPHAVVNGTNLGQIWGEGYTGTHYQIGGQIAFWANQDWSDSAQGAFMNIYLNPNGATYGPGSVIATLEWQNGLQLGVPVKATKGVFSAGSDLSGAAPSVGGGHVGLGGGTAAASNCGGGAAAGCMTINVGGTTRYVPYY